MNSVSVLNGTVAKTKFREDDGKYSDNKSWGGAAIYINVDPAPWFGPHFKGRVL
jgi:hypothetical protein